MGATGLKSEQEPPPPIKWTKATSFSLKHVTFASTSKGESLRRTRAHIHLRTLVRESYYEGKQHKFMGFTKPDATEDFSLSSLKKLEMDLGEPTHTLIPCWMPNPCLQGTSGRVGSPQPLKCHLELWTHLLTQ